jgi:hypothetical protein
MRVFCSFPLYHFQFLIIKLSHFWIGISSCQNLYIFFENGWNLYFKLKVGQELEVNYHRKYFMEFSFIFTLKFIYTLLIGTGISSHKIQNISTTPYNLKLC